MLTRSRPVSRRGFTLIELLVALVVAGGVFTLLTLAGLSQQRLLGDLFDDASLSAQVRAAAALLPVDLRAISAVGGDVRDARDTAVEIRSTIASAVVCDAAAQSVVLAPAASDATTYTSYASSIQVGDTAWLFQRGDSIDTWRPYRVTAFASVAAGNCGHGGPQLVPEVAARERMSITLDSAPPASSAVGRPLRVTRPVRYSLYRSSDGSWNLGERDWNPSAQRFNTIQPLAGPFLSPGAFGIVFAYSDSAGQPMPLPLASARALTVISLTLRGETRGAVRALGPAAQRGRRLDSVTVAVLLRNRR